MWSWADHGMAAGSNAGFVMALTVAGCFTITYCVTVVMPDKVKLYGLGHRDGYAAASQRYGDSPDGARSPLSLVGR